MRPIVAVLPGLLSSMLLAEAAMAASSTAIPAYDSSYIPSYNATYAPLAPVDTPAPPPSAPYKDLGGFSVGSYSDLGGFDVSNDGQSLSQFGGSVTSFSGGGVDRFSGGGLDYSTADTYSPDTLIEYSPDTFQLGPSGEHQPFMSKSWAGLLLIIALLAFSRLIDWRSIAWACRMPYAEARFEAADLRKNGARLATILAVYMRCAWQIVALILHETVFDMKWGKTK